MMSSKEHWLKCWPDPYEAVECGDKPFEVRKDDRHFQKGDILVLEKFDPATETYFANSALRRLITWVLRGGQFGIESGYVVLGLATVLDEAGKE